MNEYLINNMLFKEITIYGQPIHKVTEGLVLLSIINKSQLSRRILSCLMEEINSHIYLDNGFLET